MAGTSCISTSSKARSSSVQLDFRTLKNDLRKEPNFDSSQVLNFLGKHFIVLNSEMLNIFEKKLFNYGLNADHEDVKKFEIALFSAAFLN